MRKLSHQSGFWDGERSRSSNFFGFFNPALQQNWVNVLAFVAVAKLLSKEEFKKVTHF
jgi:hypothetical protein